MRDPIAFFLTWATYGTWLPGDGRGWIQYEHGWKIPQPPLELECKARQEEESCLLLPVERKLVEAQLAETCRYRNWTLHAANCRTNHVHVVVSAPATKAKKVRVDLKAYATRKLKQASKQPKRENWWAERGSIRWVWDQDSLTQVIYYTKDAQDKS
ncbi:transposase [Neorhodopirellula pilleata]|uniref:transposase n=1 Tax=Neorhodopirellula pilleata TaxID=2714738 RepID=UPI001E41B752|nr:transposase [Neorhodopirellula pilleata]